jgi:hypothetical protein
MDKILVKNGVYKENLFINKSIFIEGQNASIEGVSGGYITL